MEYKIFEKVLSVGRDPIMRGPALSAASSTAASVEHPVEAWDVASGDVFYEAVLDRYVPDDVLKAARMGLEFACAHQMITEPSMYFFQPEGPKAREYRAKYGCADWVAFRHPRDCAGLSRKLTHEIGVCVDQSPLQTAEVAAHEVRHLSHPFFKARDEDYERDAHAYGLWAADVLWDTSCEALVRAVHKGRGYPYNGTWADIAEAGDVLLAYEDDVVPDVYRNFGSKSNPRWVPYHAACPVEV